jgi:tetrahydromethanopterin S-methyltransferase subunit G
MGSSYEERELAKVNARLNKLEEKREAKVSEENTEVYQTENGVGIREKF